MSTQEKKEKKLEGVTDERYIVYGTEAWWLGRKADENGHTHRWRVYVRGPENEDLSYFLKKVIFRLHPSFDKPVREISEPPFEVTETGWGEFEIVINLHFVDENEEPIELYHPLKLFPPYGLQQRKSKPVISEHYETIVFSNPSLYLHELLLSHPQDTKKPIVKSYEVQQDDSQVLEEQKILSEAQKKVRAAIQKLCGMYEKALDEEKNLKKQIRKLEREEKKQSKS